MAYEGNLQIVPGLVAGADLSSDQFKFVEVSAGGVIVNTTQGAPVDGILQDAPTAADRPCSVARAGVSKLVAGSAIAKGDYVQSTAVGKGESAALAPSAASKDSSVGPFNMTAGDTMVIDVDNAGDATATFDTGDVVDIDAVTATEFKTVVEADTTAEVTVNADGSVTINSPTTGAASELDFKSGNVLAIVGFSVEVIVGAASGTHYAAKALEAASADGDIISVLMGSGLNT